MNQFFVVLLSIFSVVIFHANGRTLQKRAAFYIANETACVVDHTVYYNGDPIPTDDPCEACKCRPPGFACILKECEVKPGCRAVRRAGHCCPEYICGCEHNGRMYRDGDEIRDSQNPCYTCECQGSSIACAFVDCFFRVDCAPDYVPGECCPRYDHCPPIGSTSKDSLLNDPVQLLEVYSTTQAPTHVKAEHSSSPIQEQTTFFEERTTTSELSTGVTVKTAGGITSLDHDQKVTESSTNEFTEVHSTTLKGKNALLYNVDINDVSVSKTSHEISSLGSETSTELGAMQTSTTEKYEKEDATENSPLTTKIVDKSSDSKLENPEVYNLGVPGEQIQPNSMTVPESNAMNTTDTRSDENSSSTISTSAESEAPSGHKITHGTDSTSSDEFIEIHPTERNGKTEHPILYNQDISTALGTSTHSSSTAESTSHITVESTEQVDSQTGVSKNNEIKPTVEYETTSSQTTVLTSLSPIHEIYNNNADLKPKLQEKEQNASDKEPLNVNEPSETSTAEYNSTIQSDKSVQNLLKTSSLKKLSEPSETTNQTPDKASNEMVGVTDVNKEQDKLKGSEESSLPNVYTTEISSTANSKIVHYYQKDIFVSENTSEKEEITTVQPTSKTDSSEIQETETQTVEEALYTTSNTQPEKEIMDESGQGHTEV